MTPHLPEKGPGRGVSKGMHLDKQGPGPHGLGCYGTPGADFDEGTAVNVAGWGDPADGHSGERLLRGDRSQRVGRWNQSMGWGQGLRDSERPQLGAGKLQHHVAGCGLSGWGAHRWSAVISGPPSEVRGQLKACPLRPEWAEILGHLGVACGHRGSPWSCAWACVERSGLLAPSRPSLTKLPACSPEALRLSSVRRDLFSLQPGLRPSLSGSGLVTCPPLGVSELGHSSVLETCCVHFLGPL